MENSTEKCRSIFAVPKAEIKKRRLRRRGEKLAANVAGQAASEA